MTRLLTALGCLLLAGLLTADERLTTDGSLKRDPRFINNGAELIYCVDEDRDLITMMKLVMADRTTSVMIKNGNKHHIEPAMSTDGRFIAFTECTGNLTARMVIRDLQDNKDAYITHSGRGGTRSPVFSPDNQRVVYAFAESGPQQLWSVDVNGKDKKQLTESEGINNWPSFSPDGKTLVFASSRDNNYEIYSMNPDGTGEKRLTENRLMDIRPMISPDGKRIAFTSTRDYNYEVYIMNIDGSQVQRVTHSEDRDDYPCWHPDGTRLAIVSERAGRHDIYLVDVPSPPVAP